MKIFAILVFSNFFFFLNNVWGGPCSKVGDAWSESRKNCCSAKDSSNDDCNSEDKSGSGSSSNSSDGPSCKDAYELYNKDKKDGKSIDDVASLQQKLTDAQTKLQNIQPDLQAAITKIDQEISDLKSKVTNQEVAPLLNEISDANAKMGEDANNIKDTQSAYKQATIDCGEKARSDALNLLQQLRVSAHLRDNGGGPGSSVASAFSGQSDLAIVKGDVMYTGWDDLVASGSNGKAHHQSYNDCMNNALNAEKAAIRKYENDRATLVQKVNTLSGQLSGDQQHEAEQIQTLLTSQKTAQAKAMIQEQQLSAQIAQLQQQIGQKGMQNTANVTTDYANVCSACIVSATDKDGNPCTAKRATMDRPAITCANPGTHPPYAIQQLCGGSPAGIPGGGAAQ